MRYSILLLFVMLAFGCSERTTEDPDPQITGKEYFPLVYGDEWTYQLDSIIYDPEPQGIVVDTLSYQLKFVVADTFVDGVGEKAFQIDRFLRKSENDPWEISDVWSAKFSDRRLIWSQENTPFIKLVFTLKENDRWDGNALFDDDRVRVKVRGEVLDMFKFWGDYRSGTFEDEEIGGKMYADVITVNQVDKEISIEKRFSEEKYAPGQGLIYQRIIVLDTQNENVAIPFEDRAERGFIVEMTRL